MGDRLPPPVLADSMSDKNYIALPKESAGQDFGVCQNVVNESLPLTVPVSGGVWTGEDDGYFVDPAHFNPSVPKVGVV